MDEGHKTTTAPLSRHVTGQPTEQYERPHQWQQRMPGWYDDDGSRSPGGGMNQPHDQRVGGSNGGRMNVPDDEGVGGSGGGGVIPSRGEGGGGSDGGGLGASGGPEGGVDLLMDGVDPRFSWTCGFPLAPPTFSGCVARPPARAGRLNLMPPVGIMRRSGLIFGRSSSRVSTRRHATGGGRLATATLLVLQGIDQGKRVHFKDGVASLGRSPQNTVPILDTEVSRHHAQVRATDGGWAVYDLESSNGTFVNGESVRSQQIKTGDQIQIGRTVLLFTTEDPDSSSIAIAEHIDLLDADAPDRSAIVKTVTPAEGKSLARQATVARLGPMVSADANLRTLYRISEEAVRATDSLESLLERVLDLTIDAVRADRACMLISESKSDRILPKVFRHRPGIPVSGRMPISTSIVNYVIHSGEGVWTSDAQHDERFETGNSIVQAGIREAMCVPMHGRFELMGVIYVDITTSSNELLAGGRPRHFSEELLALLLAIGRQCAMAVENFRYQQALVTAERLAAVGQTIASLSHDVKNILQGLRGGSYLIDMGLKDTKEDLIRQGWTIVERNQERIYNLVNDMLTFSKERKPSLAEADLNQLVSDVAELLRGRSDDETPVRIETVLADNLPSSWFDADGILRAVLNIGGNAVDAVDGAEAACVRLSTAFDADEDELVVTVTDNGPGIPEEDLEKVFGLFESSKGARGTGLGLAVSRKILVEHGGGITVECPDEGGCRFELRWPRIVSADGDDETRPVDAFERHA